MANIENLLEDNNNAIQRRISQYDNESILRLNIEEIANSIVPDCSFPTKLELLTGNLSPSTRLVEVPTACLPMDMRIGIRKQSCQLAAVDYHITVLGDTRLLKCLPIMRNNNVSMDGDCITLTIVLDYVSLELPGEKIIEVKQEFKQWLQNANQEINALLEEIYRYNSSLKGHIMSMLKEIQNEQRLKKQQNDKLSQID